MPSLNVDDDDDDDPRRQIHCYYTLRGRQEKDVCGTNEEM